MDTTHRTPPTTAPAPDRQPVYEGLFLEPHYRDGQTWADRHEDQEALEAA